MHLGEGKVCLLIGKEGKWDQTCLCFGDKNTQKKKKRKNQLATDKVKIPGAVSLQHGNAMHLCSNISRFYLALTRKGGGGGDSFSILFLQVLRLQQGIMGTSVTAC